MLVRHLTFEWKNRHFFKAEILDNEFVILLRIIILFFKTMIDLSKWTRTDQIDRPFYKHFSKFFGTNKIKKSIPFGFFSSPFSCAFGTSGMSALLTSSSSSMILPLSSSVTPGITGSLVGVWDSGELFRSRRNFLS